MLPRIVFPGMDPYLELPAVFPGIHSRVVIYLADQLAEQIRPRYIASVGERVYVEGYPPSPPIVPDVWVRRTRDDEGGQLAVLECDAPEFVEAADLEMTEPFIEILDRESDMRVVTVIELVSPSNKYAGPGRDSYLAKQFEVRSSSASLVEIDLLRRGPHVVAVPEYRSVKGRYEHDYIACVNRARPRRSQFEVYRRTVRQPLPRIAIPLASEDADAPLDLRAALEKAYHSGSYGQRIDYSRPCDPPLSAEDQDWANQLVQPFLSERQT